MINFSSMPFSSQKPNDDDVRHKRRRLESERQLLDADRMRLLHQKEAIEVELRSLNRDLELKKGEYEEKRGQFEKLARDIQDKDAEILHLRKEYNTLS